MIIQEFYNCAGHCRTDTLNLSDAGIDLRPKDWIRSLLSSEKDLACFSHTGLKYSYKDDGSWKTTLSSNPFEKTEKRDPKFYLDMPYEKISTYNNGLYMITKQGRDLRFWIYDVQGFLANKALFKKIVPAEKLQVKLPNGVIAVFVYDDTKLGWVYKDRVEFYRFDPKKMGWEKSKIPDLQLKPQ